MIESTSVLSGGCLQVNELLYIQSGTGRTTCLSTSEHSSPASTAAGAERRGRLVGLAGQPGMVVRMKFSAPISLELLLRPLSGANAWGDGPAHLLPLGRWAAGPATATPSLFPASLCLL